MFKIFFLCFFIRCGFLLWCFICSPVYFLKMFTFFPPSSSSRFAEFVIYPRSHTTTLTWSSPIDIQIYVGNKSIYNGLFFAKKKNSREGWKCVLKILHWDERSEVYIVEEIINQYLREAKDDCYLIDRKKLIITILWSTFTSKNYFLIFSLQALNDNWKLWRLPACESTTAQ